MGTRHIIKVRKNGKDWISQYGQWDGYPSCQGVTVMKFVADGAYLDMLEGNIDREAIVPMSPEDFEKYLNELVDFADRKELSMVILDQMYAASTFCRDAGAKCLMMFAKRLGRSIAVINEPSGWEEYMYTIDFDERTVRVEELDGEQRSKEYTFDSIQRMSDKEIEDTMMWLENEWREE